MSNSNGVDLFSGFYINDSGFHNSTDGDTCIFEIETAGWINLVEGILTLVFNGIIILLLSRKSSKSNIVLLVMHLAITDLSVAVLHDFLRSLQLLTDWSYGEPLCILFLYFQQVPLYSSTFILVSLAIDRLIAIWQPLWRGRFSSRTRYGMVLIPWILAFVFSLPYINSIVEMIKGKVWCTPDFGNTFGAISLGMQVTLMFFLPAILLVCIYSYIAYLIRHKLNRPISDAISNGKRKNKLNDNQLDNMIKAERKSMCVTLVVGIAFIVCWLPYSVTIISYITKHFGIRWIEFGCSWYLMNALYPLNSLANPIIMITLNYKMFTVTDLQQGSTVKTQLSSKTGSSLSTKTSN